MIDSIIVVVMNRNTKIKSRYGKLSVRAGI